MKLFKKALALGQLTFSHFSEHPYPRKLIEEMFRGVSNDQKPWKPVVESREYEKMLSESLRNSKYKAHEINRLLFEYIYDIGVNLLRWKDIAYEYSIRQKAEIMVKDIVAATLNAYTILITMSHNVPNYLTGSYVLKPKPSTTASTIVV